jgi:hypothetical protein
MSKVCKFYPKCNKSECKFTHPKHTNSFELLDNSVQDRIKPLLILDVNGLLIYRTVDRIPNVQHHFKSNGRFVYYRPYWKEFLNFCFKNFQIAFWSTSTSKNCFDIINDLVVSFQEKPIFTFFQDDCINTGLITQDKKPIFLKNLQRVFEKYPHFNYNNTLLLDDSEYKSFLNHPFSNLTTTEWKGDFTDTDLEPVNGIIYKQLTFVVDNYDDSVDENTSFTLNDAYDVLNNKENTEYVELVKKWIENETTVGRRDCDDKKIGNNNILGLIYQLVNKN